MNVSRRVLLSSVPVFAVAACAGKTSSQLQTDVQLISAGLSAVVASLAAIPNSAIPPLVLTKAQAAIGQIQANAAIIAQALTPDATTVGGIVTAVQTLATLIGPYVPSAPAVGAAIEAALALIPIIQAAVSSSSPAGASSSKMSPDEARAALAKAAGK